MSLSMTINNRFMHCHNYFDCGYFIFLFIFTHYFCSQLAQFPILQRNRIRRIHLILLARVRDSICQVRVICFLGTLLHRYKVVIACYNIIKHLLRYGCVWLLSFTYSFKVIFVEMYFFSVETSCLT